MKKYSLQKRKKTVEYLSNLIAYLPDDNYLINMMVGIVIGLKTIETFVNGNYLKIQKLFFLKKI